MPNLNPQSDSYEALMWDVLTNAHRFIPFPGARVLDLGAHFGIFSLYCAARGACVVAYEPSAAAFENLIHSAAVASDIGIGSIKPINAAIWWHEGHGDLNLSERSTGENSLINRTGTFAVTNVPLVSLDSALQDDNNWDCVKVDIEGAEYETFMGVREENLKRIKFLTMEIHNDLLEVDLVQQLIARLEQNFPKVKKLFVKKQGADTDVVSTILCWR